MKVIIGHSVTKRLIDGAFRICGNKEDLRDIANQILAQSEDFTYGWIDIRERPRDGTLANTPPLAWDEVCVPVTYGLPDRVRD